MFSTSSTNNHKAIILSCVKKIFKIGSLRITILDNLNFECNKEDFIIFTGPSGSGKSTILNCIGGLARVDEGNVRVFNHDLNSLKEETLAIFRSIYVGFVFQIGHLIDSLTVLENVLLPIELSQKTEHDYSERAWKLLTEFKLNERASSLPVMLSGGEYQRTVFVRALIGDPDLLLIDEPTSNQDEETSQIIIRKLRLLKGKKTILVVTHDKRIFSIADEIYVPKDGLLIPYEAM